MSTLQGIGKIVTNGLVLYLDAANSISYVSGSTTWNDLSSNRNNGTLTNGPTFNSANQGSIVFDGINDYINFINSETSPLNIVSNAITLTTFLKYQTTNNWQSLFYKDNSNTKGYQLFINDTNRVAFGITTSTGFTRLIASNALSQNIWVQIAAVYDGTSMYIYVNGLLTDSTSKTGNITTSSDRPLLISFSTFGSEVFFGNISCASIYNRALSAVEVLQNYNTHKARFGIR